MFEMIILFFLLLSTLFMGNALFIQTAEAASPEISDVTVNDDNIPRYEKFEISFQLSGTWDNPFDPDQVVVDCDFQTPDGKTMTMPGFYFQDYQRAYANGRERLNPIGEPMWKVRFSPTIPGTYRYRLRVVSDGQRVEADERLARFAETVKCH